MQTTFYDSMLLASGFQGRKPTAQVRTMYILQKNVCMHVNRAWMVTSSHMTLGFIHYWSRMERNNIVYWPDEDLNVRMRPSTLTTSGPVSHLRIPVKKVTTYMNNISHCPFINSGNIYDFHNHNLTLIKGSLRYPCKCIKCLLPDLEKLYAGDEKLWCRKFYYMKCCFRHESMERFCFQLW